ncbi:MAG: tRNA (N6-isopentenyl adenosine(37)-C2)-methylthiotransferase MiaB, partial [Rhodospirillales bacterium]|nr:tRNA (N6-isopentenyl adenosine(37)-C2)-methylthiotransferase MiaB [Rhodospirillales bacterium]
MNIYDSDRMKDVLAPLGYGAVDEADDVDMVIVNTCHIREKAAEKLFSELGRYRQMKEARRENGQSTIIAVAGCVAQATGAEIINRAPFVDIVLGPQTYHRLPEMIARATRAGERNSPECACENPGAGIMDIEFPEEPKFDHLP